MLSLGFVSAILPELSLDEVLAFAAAERFACVELMCWPVGRADIVDAIGRGVNPLVRTIPLDAASGRFGDYAGHYVRDAGTVEDLRGAQADAFDDGADTLDIRFDGKALSVVLPDETGVLRALWDAGPSPIRALADRLYPGGGTSEYATVQKLLERLEDKGHVTRKLEGRQNVFTARVRREDLVARRLRETADELCDGSLTPLITRLKPAST